MQLHDIHKVYFLGIGGIGMSALARYFRSNGVEVAGYDKTPTLLTSELESEGIRITFEDSIDTLIPDADLVVITPAIPAKHVQKAWYTERQTPMMKRAQVLGLIANAQFNISIAGSHGKTSTSSLVAFLLNESNRDVAAFLGGVSINYQSNFIFGNTYAVAEADEFDRSFLQLTPDIALVTSVDTDHLDIYGNFDAIKDSFSAFLSQVRTGGHILIHHGVDRGVLPTNSDFKTYDLENTAADYHTEGMHIVDGSYHFNLVTPNLVYKNLVLHYGGRHNVENAVGACAIAHLIGLSEDEIRSALADFKGVRRRFETHYKTSKKIYIDDYAHHPREIDAALSAVRQLYPELKLTVVFQPHLFSRTKDLAEEFAVSLSKADNVILLPIYPARELPVEGVTSSLILNAMTITQKRIVPKESVLQVLQNAHVEVLMTIGAGDIDTLINPIAEWLKKGGSGE